jgi:serine/threonine protein kinase
LNAPRHHNALAPGHQVHWYRIDEVLGQGSFGITYRARDLNLDTDIALKEYFPSVWAVRLPDHGVAPSGPASATDFEWGLSRFISEGRILVRFDHPALVRAMSIFEANNTAYLVMRFETGAVLHEVLAHAEALAEDDLKALIRPLLDGLGVMHAAGVIHRDIKPNNIFIRSDGSPLLIDFGAARETRGSKAQELTSIGTAGYAPIEQYSDDTGRQGPWTDLYALGATIYHAIAGRAPKDALVRANDIVSGKPDPLVSLTQGAHGTLSARFLRAIERSMAFRPEDRPQSAREFADELGITLEAGAAPPGREAPTEMLASTPRTPQRTATTVTADPLAVDTNQWEIDGLRRAIDEVHESAAARPRHGTRTRAPAPAPEREPQRPPPRDPADDYAVAIGLGKQDYYLPRLAATGGRPGVSWNWAAALFTSAWLMYRKLYLWALLVYPLIVASSLAGAWWAGGIAFPGDPRAQVAVLGAWLIGLSLLGGLFGNALYGHHLRGLIEQTEQLDLEPAEQHRRLRRKGGTNTVLAAIYAAGLLAAIGAGAWFGWQLLARAAGGA